LYHTSHPLSGPIIVSEFVHSGGGVKVVVNTGMLVIKDRSTRVDEGPAEMTGRLDSAMEKPIKHPEGKREPCDVY
jgi:hypothetical protein